MQEKNISATGGSPASRDNAGGSALRARRIHLVTPIHRGQAARDLQPCVDALSWMAASTLLDWALRAAITRLRLALGCSAILSHRSSSISRRSVVARSPGPVSVAPGDARSAPTRTALFHRLTHVVLSPTDHTSARRLVSRVCIAANRSSVAEARARNPRTDKTSRVRPSGRDVSTDGERPAACLGPTRPVGRK
jgi:hypothetical protein